MSGEFRNFLEYSATAFALSLVLCRIFLLVLGWCSTLVQSTLNEDKIRGESSPKSLSSEASHDFEIVAENKSKLVDTLPPP